jgi:hypothetical protein
VRSGANLFQGSTVDHGVSHDFETEVVQVVNRKFVDLIPLYNFCKGRMVFCSTIFAQKACQDADFLGASE